MYETLFLWFQKLSYESRSTFFLVFGEMSFRGAHYKSLFRKKSENEEKCILIKNVAYHLMYETLFLWF